MRHLKQINALSGLSEVRIAVIVPLLIAGMLTGAWLPHGSSVSAPFGPGSPGFLSTCSSTFNTVNVILQSQAFATSPWNAQGGVVSAPTMTNNAALAPDSTMTATSMVMPAVTGANAYSIVSQPFTAFAGYSVTGDVYIKGAAGGEKIWVSGIPGGYTSQAVIATTSWQRIPVTWLPAGSSQTFQIGVDLRDGTQTASSAQTVYLWGAQVAGGFAEWPYIPTTSSTVSQTQVVNCPPGVAFRDFSGLTAYAGDPITTQSTTAYNTGGVSEPFVSEPAKIGGTYYALAYCTVTGATRNTWPNLCLYTGPDVDHWTNYAGNPVLTNSPPGVTYGFIHPTISPSCSVAVYCWYFSAAISGSFGIYLATSNDGVSYSLHGAPVIATSNQNEPTIVQIGSTLHMIVAFNGFSGSFLQHFTSPASDGLTWTQIGQSLLPTLATDWDGLPGQNETAVFDPWVIKNKHGFYEMTWTAFLGGGTYQNIGYAVSADCLTWFKYQAGPIMTYQVWGHGTNYIGDTALFEDATTFHVLYHNDNNSNVSNGYDAQLPGY